MPNPPEALLNVRVLDQDVVDELSKQLATHLEQATRALEAMAAMLARTEEWTSESVATAGELQQRLQLGGQLLRALTDEMGRVQPISDKLAAHADNVAEATEAMKREQLAVHEHIVRAIGEIGEARRDAERACRETSSRAEQVVTRLDSSTLALEDSRRVSDAARQLLEQASNNLATHESALARRSDDMERRVDIARSEMDSTIADLRAAKQAAETRGQALAEDVIRLQGEIGHLESRIAEQAADADEAAARLEAAAKTIDEQKQIADNAGAAVTAGLEKFQSEFSAALVYLENRKRELERTQQSIDTRLAGLEGAADRAIEAISVQQHENEATRAEVSCRADEIAAMGASFMQQVEQGGQAVTKRLEGFEGKAEAIEQRLQARVESATTEVADRLEEIRSLAADAEQHLLTVEASGKAAERSLEARTESALADFELRSIAAKATLDERCEATISEVDAGSKAVERALEAHAESALAAFDLRSNAAKATLDERCRSTLSEVEAGGKAVERTLEAHMESAVAELERRSKEAKAEFDTAYESTVREFEAARDSAETSLETRGESIGTEFERRVADLQSELEARAGELGAQLEVRAEDFDSEIRAAEITFDTRQEAAIIELHRRLDDARTSATAYAEELRTSLDARVKELDGIAERTEDRLTEVEANSRAAEKDLERRQTDVVAEIERCAIDSRASLEIEGEDVRQRVVDLESLFGEMIDKVGVLVDSRHASSETMGSLRSELESAMERLSGIESDMRGQRGLSDLVEVLGSRLDATNEHLDAVASQLETLSGVEGLEDRLGSRIGEVLEQSREAVADLGARLAELDGAASADTVESLESLLLEIGERVEASPGAEAVEALSHRVSDLADRLDGVRATEPTDVIQELDRRVRELMDRLDGEGRKESEVRGRLAEIESQVSRVTEQVETEVASAIESVLENHGATRAALDSLEVRSSELSHELTALRSADAETGGAVAGDLASRVDTLESQIIAALTRMESEIAPAIVRLDESIRVTDDAVQELEIADRDLRIEIAMTRDVLAEGPSSTNAESGQLARENLASVMHAIEANRASIAELRNGLGELPEMRERLSDLASRASAGHLADADTTMPLSESVASHVEAAVAKVEKRIEPALEVLETQRHGAEDAVGRMEQQLQALQSQIDAALGHVETTSPAEPTPGAGDGLTATARSILDSPIGRRVKAFVAAINRGDRGVYAEFINSNYASASVSRMGLDQRLAVFHTLHTRSQGITIRHVEMIGDSQLRMVVRTNAGGWEEYVFAAHGPEAGIESITVDPIEEDQALAYIRAA